MHIMILVLFSISVTPIAITLIFLGTYFHAKFRGHTILDLYWVSAFFSILLSGVGTYIYWLDNGNITGLEHTAAKAAGISAIVCVVYLIFLYVLLKILSLFKKPKQNTKSNPNHSPDTPH